MERALRALRSITEVLRTLRAVCGAFGDRRTRTPDAHDQRALPYYFGPCFRRRAGHRLDPGADVRGSRIRYVRARTDIEL